MKKVVSLLVMLAMLVTFTACGNGQKTNTNPNPTNSAQNNQSTASANKEAPMLTKLVSDGKLPALKDRLPAEPLVVKPSEGIGIYGGVYKGAAFGPTSGQADTETLRAQSLLQINPDLKTFSPNIVKDYKMSDDFKSVTLTLRKGMKWSDGTPFTADDFMFWYNDIANNKDLTPAPNSAWLVGGKMFKMEKVDDTTIKISFESSNPSFEVVLAKSYSYGRFFAPMNYLKQYHIKYNPQANDLAKQEKFESWIQCFQSHLAFGQDRMDTKMPDITPWVLTKIDDLGNKYFDRNPYYYKVDSEGNQLPYIDQQVAVIVKDAQVRTMKLVSGELHAAAENPLPVKDYTLYKENEQKGDYTVYLFENSRGSDAGFVFNYTHKDPVLRKIFNDVKFRQAMSLAIDRKQINDTLFFGKATIRSAITPNSTSFFQEGMDKNFTDYNVDKANALLDEIGLVWDSSHKVRMRPDGKPLQIVLEATEEFAPQSEMVAEYWTKVGVQTTMKQDERTFFYQRGPANDCDVRAWTCDVVAEFSFRSSLDAGTKPFTVPYNAAPLWETWFSSQGKSGEEPPAAVKKVFDDAAKLMVTPVSSPDYKKLGQEILQIETDNLWVIGTSVAPRVVMISNKLSNTPKKGTFAADYNFWYPYGGDTWFLKGGK